jgi:hypothetical protein
MINYYLTPIPLYSVKAFVSKIFMIPQKFTIVNATKLQTIIIFSNFYSVSKIPFNVWNLQKTDFNGAINYHKCYENCHPVSKNVTDIF